jgi:hypothetical protein
VAPSIDAGDAEIVDASQRIVMPGFVNAHIHTWQTALRGIAANWTIPEYLHNMHAKLAPAFTPTDIFVSNLVGALNQLNSGITSIVDWCHNNPTPAHTDAAIEALIESGIRGVFLHGSPKPDPKPGQKHFSEIPHPRSEIERLKRGKLAADDGLVTLGMAILGPAYSISAWRARSACWRACMSAAARCRHRTASSASTRRDCSGPTSTSSMATISGPSGCAGWSAAAPPSPSRPNASCRWASAIR